MIVVILGVVMFLIEWIELFECGFFEVSIYVKDESEVGVL